jgi:hypothetical protein
MTRARVAGQTVPLPKWRYLSLAFVLVIFLIALWVWTIIHAVQQDRSRFASSLQEGRIIVQAIYNYKAKKGKWPERLDDLVPAFLASLPENWTYQPPPDGLLTKLAAFHTYLTYYFPPEKGEPVDPDRFPQGNDHGWIKDNEGQTSFLGVD